MVYCEMAWVGVANWCLHSPGIRHPESSPCHPKSPPCLPESSPHCISLSHRCPGERQGGGVPPARVGAGQISPGDFQDNSIPAPAGVPSLRVWISDFGACRVLRYYFGTRTFLEHMSAQLHCWNMVRLKHTICFFQMISGAIHTFFPLSIPPCTLHWICCWQSLF